LQAATSGASSHVAAAESLTSEMSTSSPSVANVSISYEPGENTVSVLYTPPCQTSPGSSPLETTVSGPPPVTAGGYKTIPISEPDLSKIPERSALKGGKRRQLKDRQRSKENEPESAALQLSPNPVTTPPHPAAIQFMSTGVLPRAPPKVAPKPRTGP